MPHDITRGQIGELETVRKPLVELFGVHFEIAALLSVSAVSFQLSGGFFWGGGVIKFVKYMDVRCVFL